MKTSTNAQHSGRRNYMLLPYKVATIILLLTAFSSSMKAQMATATGEPLNLEKGIAISGYDPVAYFTLGKATQGKNTISFTQNGATYYFATDANRQLFIKEPAKYQPQYGGWCAYAMATSGEKVEIDPQTYKIVNGKLLLFYNKFFNNTLNSWNKNEKGYLPLADTNWKKITNK